MLPAAERALLYGIRGRGFLAPILVTHLSGGDFARRHVRFPRRTAAHNAKNERTAGDTASLMRNVPGKIGWRYTRTGQNRGRYSYPIYEG